MDSQEPRPDSPEAHESPIATFERLMTSLDELHGKLARKLIGDKAYDRAQMQRSFYAGFEEYSDDDPELVDEEELAGIPEDGDPPEPEPGTDDLEAYNEAILLIRNYEFVTYGFSQDDGNRLVSNTSDGELVTTAVQNGAVVTVRHRDSRQTPFPLEPSELKELTTTLAREAYELGELTELSSDQLRTHLEENLNSA